MQSSQVLGIIPARGGSKGIPRKNVRLLAGKPLVVHSIVQLQQSGKVGRVAVSTDDDEIASVAKQWGAEVIKRPAEISGDTASSESALVHALEHYRTEEKYEPELVVFLQATSPLRAAEDVSNAVETLQREGADSLFSACRVEGFVWKKAPGELSPINYDPVKRPRRQELTSEVLEENGSIYVFRPWVLKTLGSRLGGRIAVLPMPRLRSFQIDVPEDWHVLESLMNASPAAASGVKLAGVRLLVLDFDGVMTDNRVYVDQDGHEAVACHRGDGWGLARLKDIGLEVLVLSTEANPVVAARCAKLRIGCVQNCADKLAALKELVARRQLAQNQVAFVGNDVNDADCLEWVGVPIVVADAVAEVRPLARLITSRPGGSGAVREVADWILAARRGQ